MNALQITQHMQRTRYPACCKAQPSIEDGDTKPLRDYIGEVAFALDKHDHKHRKKAGEKSQRERRRDALARKLSKATQELADYEAAVRAAERAKAG